MLAIDIVVKSSCKTKGVRFVCARARACVFSRSESLQPAYAFHVACDKPSKELKTKRILQASCLYIFYTYVWVAVAASSSLLCYASPDKRPSLSHSQLHTIVALRTSVQSLKGGRCPSIADEIASTCSTPPHESE